MRRPDARRRERVARDRRRRRVRRAQHVLGESVMDSLLRSSFPFDGARSSFTSAAAAAAATAACPRWRAVRARIACPT